MNIIASIGTKTFAFMWTASACAIVGWLVQMGLCCCCASRRDVTRGRKVGRRKGWRQTGNEPPSEKSEKCVRKGLFGRKQS